MDYLKKVTLVVCTYLAIVRAQNIAENSFTSRYNEETNLNSLSYDVIDKGTQNVYNIPPQNSFHDIYTLKGQAGESQRVHYAVDDNGPRADFQSNTVQFRENFVPTNNYFGARINIKQPDMPGVSQEYPTRKYKILEEVQTVQALSAEAERFGHPVVLPASFVSSSPLQSQILPNSLNVHENNRHNFKNRLSTGYETSPIQQVSDLPFISIDQRYDSRRISKPQLIPLSDDMTKTAPEYSPLMGSVPNTASAYTPLFNNVPSYTNSEYQQNFDNEQFAINRFDVSKNYEHTFNNRESKSIASLPLNSLVEPALPNSTPTPLQFLSNEIKSQVPQENVPQKLGEEPNFQNEIPSETHLSDKIISKYSEKDSTTIRQQNISPKINSYFTTKAKLSPSLLSVPSFSKSIISSPMATVFDTSNENGKYYHYVMNLGQSSQNNEQGKPQIFSTGNALYKLLNETAIQFQPSPETISNKGINNIKGGISKKYTKAFGILSKKVKGANSKNSIGKVMFDLQTAGDSIDSLNLTQEKPSNNISIPVTFNKKRMNVSDEILQQISRILNRDEFLKPPAKLTSPFPEVESSTLSVVTESYTLSPFLEDLFDIHEEINVPPKNYYQEIPIANTQSSLDTGNEDEPLFKTVPQNISDFYFVSSNSTKPKSQSETSHITSTLFNESTITSSLLAQTKSVNEITYPATSKPIVTPKTDSSSTPFEEASSSIPTSVPSLSITSFEVIDQTTTAKGKTSSEKDNISTVSVREDSTTDSSTGNTTPFTMSISPIKVTEKDLPASGNRSFLNEMVNVETASFNRSLGNIQAENLVKSMNHESDKPMLELVIPSTEMKDFMSKINSISIFIRVLNPKRAELQESQRNFTAADDDVQKSVLDFSPFQIAPETNLTLNHLPGFVVEEHFNKTNLHSVNNLMKGESFDAEVKFQSMKDTKMLSLTAKNDSMLTGSKVLQPQLNTNKTMPENIFPNSNDIQVEDNTSFTPLGEESKANVEVLRSNEPLHLIPIFFERGSEASDYDDFKIVPDTIDNIFIEPVNDDITERLYSGKLTSQQYQNAENKNIPSLPISIEHVVHTPYRDFNINGEVSNPIYVGYDSNNQFTHEYDSVNLTDGLFQNIANNNDYEFSPSLEYIDLPHPELSNKDSQILHPVKEVLENRMSLSNLNNTFVQNFREINNAYDSFLPHDHIGITSYGDIDNSDQGQIFLSEDVSNQVFLNRLYSSNLTDATLQNVFDSGSGYTQTQPVEYVALIPYTEYNHNVEGPNYIPNDHFVVDATNEFMVGNENNNGLHNSASSDIQPLPFSNKYIDFMHYGDSVDNIQRSDDEESPISDTFFTLSNYGELPRTTTNDNKIFLLEDNSNFDFGNSMKSPQGFEANKNMNKSPAHEGSANIYGTRISREIFSEDGSQTASSDIGKINGYESSYNSIKAP